MASILRIVFKNLSLVSPPTSWPAVLIGSGEDRILYHLSFVFTSVKNATLGSALCRCWIIHSVQSFVKSYLKRAVADVDVDVDVAAKITLMMSSEFFSISCVSLGGKNAL